MDKRRRHCCFKRSDSIINLQPQSSFDELYPHHAQCSSSNSGNGPKKPIVSCLRNYKLEAKPTTSKDAYLAGGGVLVEYNVEEGESNKVKQVGTMWSYLFRKFYSKSKKNEEAYKKKELSKKKEKNVQKEARKHKSKEEKSYPEPMNDIDISKLIRLYCRHENLYNPKNYYYGDMEISEDTYNDMARSFPSYTPLEIRTKAEELRNLFECEYFRLERAKRDYGEVVKPSIQFYDEFSFLIPYLNMHKSKSGLSNDSSADTYRMDRLPSYIDRDRNASPNDFISDDKPLEMDDSHSLYSQQQSNQYRTQVTIKPRGNESVPSINDSLYQQQHQKQQHAFPKERAYNRQLAMGMDSSLGVYQNEPNASNKLLLDPLRAGMNGLQFFVDQADDTTYNKSQVPTQQPQQQQQQLQQQQKQFPQQQFHQQPHFQQQQQLEESFVSIEDSCSCENVSEEPIPSEQIYNGSIESSIYSNEKTLNSCPLSSRCDCPCPSMAVEHQKKGQKRRYDVSSCKSTEISTKKCTSNKSTSAMKNVSMKITQDAQNPAPSSTPPTSEINTQVQMLCDMIKTELSDSPDFIYFDAKWRIIEILRDVHKRQLVHMKSSPEPGKCSCRCMNAQLKNNVLSKPISSNRATACPYCCIKKSKGQ